MRLAYVTTGYPYVSHTFIQNEVLMLRELGAEIDTFAITRAPRSECRTAADREAWETTYALRPPKLWHYLRAHGSALFGRPGDYVATLKRMLRMGGAAPTDAIRHLAYFVQGVVLWNRCRLANIRHIHAHFANVSSDVALVACALAPGELTWSYTMHGPTEFYDVGHYRLAEKTTAAEFVICVSDFARSQLMALTSPEHWQKLHVVRCGVDTRRFTPVQDRASDVVRITCVGRLVPEKGQSLLIDALRALRAAGLRVELRLAGDGPRRAALEQQAATVGLAEHVTFLGSVPHTEVDRLLRDTDIFCLPSFAEGVPIVLMEAMAMGLPVVACQVMGIPELIDDGVSGRLVRPGSLEDLVAALELLSRDSTGRRELGRAARERVASDFDLRSNVRRLHDVYAQSLPR